MGTGENLARWRVPLGWGFGLAALWLARPTPVLYGTGVLVAAAGEVIRLWAAGHLEKNRAVARAGPYAWTRNPLYFGSLFVGVGFALATGRWELLVVVATLFVAVYRPVMKREARGLGETHPESYVAYAERVPLFFPRWPSQPAPGEFSWARVLRNREHLTLCGWVIVAGVLAWKLLKGSGLL